MHFQNIRAGSRQQSHLRAQSPSVSSIRPALVQVKSEESQDKEYTDLVNKYSIRKLVFPRICCPTMVNSTTIILI